MKLDNSSREILKQYKSMINNRRRANGQRELTIDQVIAEILEYMTFQSAVFLGGHFIQQK
ncbi:hypothetical protein [Serratia fonticola]|uniref:hypothetical protein n=1 Tax=Serratia fonticola TaxID=47917 RepID=UPI00211B9E9B|nr:hypothetical protein [Serratia fonticola]